MTYNLGLREIKGLRVRCVNSVCEWTGTVAILEDHVGNTCIFTIVSCSNHCEHDDGRDLCTMRKDFQNHLKTECPNRFHRCSYCGEEGSYASITGEHDQEYLKRFIPCL